MNNEGLDQHIFVSLTSVSLCFLFKMVKSAFDLTHPNDPILNHFFILRNYFLKMVGILLELDK